MHLDVLVNFRSLKLILENTVTSAEPKKVEIIDVLKVATKRKMERNPFVKWPKTINCLVVKNQGKQVHGFYLIYFVITKKALNDTGMFGDAYLLYTMVFNNFR